MQVSCTADATSDVARRVNKAIHDNKPKQDSPRLVKLKEVQGRIDTLKKRGFLKRQEYAAANSSDFHKMYLKQR